MVSKISFWGVLVTVVVGLYVWVMLLGWQTGKQRQAERAAAVASWKAAVQSGRCEVESFGFDRYGTAESAVYLCADTGRHIGPVLR
jgi:ABC-type transport system involved in Fe-S cluster assembly fused permease/ATPase subunit